MTGNKTVCLATNKIYRQTIFFRQGKSEEGGRFYHLRNRYLLVEAPEDETLELPESFIWMTLRQIAVFLRTNNVFNVEARGLLSCLSLLNDDIKNHDESDR